MKDNSILDPVDMYPGLKEKVIAQAGEDFDALIKKGKVKVEANRETCKRYYETKEKLEKAQAELSSAKGKSGLAKGFAIFFFVAAVVAVIVAVFGFMNANYLMGGISIGVVVLGVVVGILLWRHAKGALQAAIEAAQKKVNQLDAECKKLLAEAYAQMNPANALFDWGMPQKAISTAVPLFQMDENFDVEKYTYLIEKYGVPAIYDNDTSIEFVQSGSIVGNPFLIERVHKKRMVQKRYTGSITITYTTTVSTKNGTRTVVKTATLTAAITKPAPSYHYETFLVYANEAAPKLCFSRSPQVDINSSEKDLEKQVRSGAKGAKKKAEKELMDDNQSTNFTAMSNDEFEVLWHAWDRNDEAQFRLLFTPLAQQNELEIIKSKAPYGDDFHFTKEKMVNVIGSKHSQSANYYADPDSFAGFDHDKMRENFVNYVTYYFQNFYWDAAPLIAIPLYQQMKPREYIYGHAFKSNLSRYEHEVLANTFDKDILKPQDCCTDIINKVKLDKKNGPIDEVTITAYGFRGEPRVEYVPEMGPDGRLHNIPVHWVEYIPVTKKTQASFTNANASKNYLDSLSKNQGYQNLLKTLSKSPLAKYSRRLGAYLGGFSPETAKQLSALLSPKAEEKEKPAMPESTVKEKTGEEK